MRLPATAGLMIGVMAAIAAAANEQAPQPPKVADLAPNTWTLALQETDGGSIAAPVYAPEAGGVLFYGYRAGGTKKSAVEVYRASTNEWRPAGPGGKPLPNMNLSRGTGLTTWTAVDGAAIPQLPCPNREWWQADQQCYVPTVKKVLYFAGGSTFYFDPATGAFENLEIPLDQAPPATMLGVMAFDPVNNEVVHFGGGYVRSRSGDWNPRDTWLFSPQTRQWRRLEAGPKEKADRFARLQALADEQVALTGETRKLAFGYLGRIEGLSAADQAKRQSDLADRAKTLGAADAAAALAQAADALKEGDGWKALHAQKRGQEALEAAAEATAVAPPPRYYAACAADEKDGKLVLFGGHGGDRWLADTWVYDFKTRTWEQRHPAVHPGGGDANLAMAYDSKRGLVVLVRGAEVWTYDVTKDEWSRWNVASVKGFQHWMSLAYDPSADVLVCVTCPHGTYGDFGARNTLWLRLDPAAATKADVQPGGAEWGWLIDKVGESWKHAPKSQAEYDARVATQGEFLKGLKPNEWAQTQVPYRAQERGYGSFCLDPLRGQIIYWGGGHSAYMGNEWSQLDLKSSLWFESWNPDIPPWPFGAPDGAGWHPPFRHVQGTHHGYYHYTFEPRLKRIMYAGTRTYDPDRMRWNADERFRQPEGALGMLVAMSGADHPLLACARSYYRGGPFGVSQFDAEAGAWTKLVTQTPFGSNDRKKPVFDSTRRAVLVYGGQSGGNQVCNELWSFSLDEKKWTKIEYRTEPADAQAPSQNAWGVAYSPKHDILLVRPGNHTTWVYDFKTNVLRQLEQGRIGGPWDTCGVEWDPIHEVFWTIQGTGYGVGPVNTWALRYQAP